MSSQWDPELPDEDNGGAEEEEYLQSLAEFPNETIPEVEEKGQTNNNNQQQNTKGTDMSAILSIGDSTGDNKSGSLDMENTPRFNKSNNKVIGNLKNGNRQKIKKVERLNNEITDISKTLDRGYFIKKDKEGKIIHEKLDSAVRSYLQAKLSALRYSLEVEKVKTNELSIKIKQLSLSKKVFNNTKLKTFKINQKINLVSKRVKNLILQGSQNGSKGFFSLLVLCTFQDF